MPTTDLPYVLISNDDGFDAPGLAALYTALEGIARVDVVAPAMGVSSAGHGVTDRRPIRVERQRVEPFGVIHLVDALPADCVRLALTELLDARPDRIISGINRGGNLGVDIYYSGTVAVAREAAFMGVPAIAVSHRVRDNVEPDWSRAARWTHAIVDRLLSLPLDPAPPIWNVNLPAVSPGGEHRGVVVAPMALTPLQIRYQTSEGHPGSAGVTYQFAGEYAERPAPTGTDVDYTFNGYISVTPLSLDLTCAISDPIRAAIAS